MAFSVALLQIEPFGLDQSRKCRKGHGTFCTEDFPQTLSQERNLKESLLASFRRAQVPCKIRQRIRCARSCYGEEVCIPSPKARRRPQNRDGDGNHIYNELLLGLTPKETATLLRIRIFVGNCAYRFRGKYFSATNQKRSSGCHGWRLTIGS
jgi:hypothetical protein